MPFVKHQKGTRSELIVAAHMVDLGFFVFSPVVHQQGPIDIVAIDSNGRVFLIDAKTDGGRVNPKGLASTRIHRVRTPTQKEMNVRIAYVAEDNAVHFVPALDLTID